MEASEEHYKEKLKYVDEQREQLIKEIEAYKSQLRELSEQVRYCIGRNRGLQVTADRIGSFLEKSGTETLCIEFF